MRELKFRAWNHEDKKMEQVFGLSWVDKVDTEDEPESRFTNQVKSILCDEPLKESLAFRKACWEDRAKYTLMQFTGLKDKNGVEIYEDDLVKAKNKYNSTEEKYPKYKIAFRDGSFYGVSLKKHHVSGKGLMWIFLKLDDYIEMGTCEIIGNIHQNPELLKV